MIERQNLPTYFRMFDFASPDATNAQRHETTVPQQALFLMNSPFMTEEARAFAARSQGPPAQRIQQMYRLAFNRDPQEDETRVATAFLEKSDADKESVVTKNSVWKYGYGRYDPKSQCVAEFTPFPYWAGDMWRGGAQYPDPVLHHAALSAIGGHTGADQQHSVIRRWMAPTSGVVSIDAKLNHVGMKDCGDGVQGWIVSSRLGEVGTWIARNNQVATPVAHIPVQEGDIIDFVAGCRGDANCDSFAWSPNIRLIYGQTVALKVDFRPGEKEKGLQSEVWEAQRDFSGPPPQPLDAWGQYAQVLLLTNEFLFVD
jgi:hypothetical protein